MNQSEMAKDDLASANEILCLRVSELEKSLAEKQQTTEELKARIKTMAAASRAADLALWEWDIGSDRLTWTDNVDALIGYERGHIEHTIQAWNELIHADDRAMVWEHLEKHLNEGSPYDVHYRIKRKDGRYHWWRDTGQCLRDKSGKAYLMSGACMDISKQKHAEDDLREQIRFLQVLIDSIPAPVFFKDTEGRYLGCNKALEDMLGVPRDRILGKTMYDFAPKFLADLHLRSDLDLFSQGGFQAYESIAFNEKGEKRQIVVTKATFDDRHGKLAGLIGTIFDMTDTKRLEARVRQTQKLEAIGTLAGGIAHDFNNMLGAISGYTELSLEQVPADSKVKGYLMQIFKATRRAVDLVSQILDFSRQKEQERRPLRVGPLVKEATKLLRATIPKTIDIRTNITTEVDTVLADPSQIHQLLTNLCTNAYQAMKSDTGLLDITLSNVSINTDAKAPSSLWKPGPYLKLSVRDTGQGIEPDHIERIFDPFFTTQGLGEAPGLGLSVVHGIVKNHGGEITVESQTGKGTEISVYLPLVEDQQDRKTPSSDSLIIGGSEHILVVDDEEMLAKMTKALLEGLGYKVTAKTDSIEALESFQSDPQGYDLVITDHAMPVMTGLSLAAAIMNIRPEIPVFLCTGFSSAVDPEIARKAGIREFVMKPVTRRHIAELIRKALGNG